MKSKHLLIALTLGLGLPLVLLWLLGGGLPAHAAPEAELHVCHGGCAYSSIQAAVDDANSNDVIKVAAGTYTGVNVRPRNDITTTGFVTQVVYISKTVTIRGGYTTTNWTVSDLEANPTTLDAGSQGRVIYITGDISPTIEGLRITNGDATGLGGESFWRVDAGGGVFIFNAAAIIRDNQVFGNHVGNFGNGGGLFLSSSTARLNGNTITNNTAGNGGGVAIC